MGHFRYKTIDQKVQLQFYGSPLEFQKKIIRRSQHPLASEPDHNFSYEGQKADGTSFALTAMAGKSQRQALGYSTIERVIEGHPRGDFNSYSNFSFSVAEQYLRQYMLNKRGYE